MPRGQNPPFTCHIWLPRSLVRVPYAGILTFRYPNLTKAHDWLEQEAEMAKTERQNDTDLCLPAHNPRAANTQQRLPIAIALHALYCHTEKVDSHLGVPFEPRRVLMLGRPGVGKTFVSHVIILLTRMVKHTLGAAVVGAPSGIAAFVAGGRTWHSLLGIPCGKKFIASFQGVGAPEYVQDTLAHLFAVIGDELSMTGRTLLGWIAHRLCTGVARGAGSLEPPIGGSHVPFALLAGDYHQLPPVFDTALYKSVLRNSNSNYGRQVHSPTSNSVSPPTSDSFSPPSLPLWTWRSPAWHLLAFLDSGVLPLRGRGDARYGDATGRLAGAAAHTPRLHAQWRRGQGVRFLVHQVQAAPRPPSRHARAV